MNRRFEQSFTLAYITVLGLLALSAIGSFIIFERHVSLSESREKIITLGERQRYLLEAIRSTALRLSQAHVQDETGRLGQRLKALAAQLRYNHDELIGRQLSPQLQAIYFQAPESLDRQIQDFLKHIDVLSAPPRPSLNKAFVQASPALLAGLEVVIAQSKKEDAAQVRMLNTLARVSLAITLALLAASGFGVFRPLVRRLKNELAQRASAEAQQRQSHRLMIDAIESIDQGFVLFDANDRLVLCNSPYRKMYQGIADLLVPGVGFEDLVRATAARGLTTESLDRADEWVQERLERYRHPPVRYEEKLADGRWLCVEERRIRGGGTVDIHTDVTELKQAEQRWQFALEGSGDGVWDWNLETHEMYYSSRWKKMLGYEDAEISHSFEEWKLRIHPQDQPWVLAELDRILAGEQESFIGELRMQCKDGADKWILSRGKVMAWTPARKPLRIVGTHKDISRRKQAEFRLLRLKNLFAMLAQTNEAIVYHKDRDSLFQEVCRIAVEHGHFKMAWIGLLDEKSRRVKPVACSGQPQDYLEQVPIIADISTPEGRGPAEKAVRCGDYHIENDFPNDPDVAPWREKIAQAGFGSVGVFAFKQEGETIGVLVVYAEETGFFDQELIGLMQAVVQHVSHALDNVAYEIQGRQAVAQLEQTQARLRHVLDVSPAGIFALDLDLSNPESPYRLTFASQTIEAMIGYTASEWGDNPLEFWRRHLHPADLSDLASAERRAELFERGQLIHDYRFRHKNGAYCWLHSRTVLIRDARGAPREIIGAWLDITDYKHAQEQLQGAQKMEIVGRLTGGIAHDFNNMLAVMLNCLQLLQRRIKDDGRAEKYVHMALESAQRGRDITRNLLAFSRRQVLDLCVLDPNKIVSELASMLRQAVGEAIDLNVSLAENAWCVKLDQAQLESALLNLCLNARDAMPEGGRLSIQTANAYLDAAFTAEHPWQIETGPYVMIAVSDTGVGMSPEIQAQVFEPFFTTKTGKGTGLGLSMVYGFVKQSKGHIIVYSEEGFGTAFKLYFPKADGAANGLEAASVEATELPGGRETILVVEDDPAVREIHSMLIEELGYRVLKAENGPQALAMIDTRPDIDLLFSDVVMPGGMSGLRLAQQAQARLPRLKILLVSGYPTDILEDQQQLHGAPVGHYELLMKPFTRNTVAVKIRQVLNCSGQNVVPGLER